MGHVDISWPYQEAKIKIIIFWLYRGVYCRNSLAVEDVTLEPFWLPG